MRNARAIGLSVLLGLLSWAIVGRGLVNYDTLYALVWGRDLAHGRSPDLTVPLAPTQHPLANAVGVLFSPLGDGATTAALLLAFLSLGALGWVVYRLGAEWFNPAAGVLAAAIVLTRRPVLDFGARAYVDIPYLVLVLAALLIETRRRRAGAPVLALLAVAGLLRPEAWLLTGAYLAWLWIGGQRDLRLLAIAAAGPLLWCLSDLVLTGDPLHSLLGTRETTAELARVTGLQNVPLTMPRRLGEILREPVLVGAAGGGVLALWLLRRRAALGAVTGGVAVGAFCVLATAGLPILGRYLLLPAAILAVFCGAGAFGWAELPRGHPWRRRWAIFGAFVGVLMVAFAPGQASRIGKLGDALARQDQIQRDLHALTPAMRCAPVAVPNHRPVPLLALWLDRPAQDVVVAQDAHLTRGTYVAPANKAVAKDYVLDPRDTDQRIPPPPTGFRPLAANRSWRVAARC
ncbi:MAG: hypothetical protein M3P44_11565 [Actinomycetota bacterium]|nr:hypothetical protein [Actinomycetota bacterium]